MSGYVCGWEGVGDDGWVGSVYVVCVRGFVQRRAMIIVRKAMLVKDDTGVH